MSSFRSQIIKDKAESMIQKLDCDAFPPVQGKAVYAVVVQNIYFAGAEHIMYIGSSKDLHKRRRLNSHPYNICRRRFQGLYRNVCYKYFYSESMEEDEAFLINYLCPPMNRKHNRKWIKPRSLKDRKYNNQKLLKDDSIS